LNAYVKDVGSLLSVRQSLELHVYTRWWLYFFISISIINMKIIFNFLYDFHYENKYSDEVFQMKVQEMFQSERVRVVVELWEWRHYYNSFVSYSIELIQPRERKPIQPVGRGRKHEIHVTFRFAKLMQLTISVIEPEMLLA
jgi:hypothetical protein